LKQWRGAEAILEELVRKEVPDRGVRIGAALLPGVVREQLGNPESARQAWKHGLAPGRFQSPLDIAEAFADRDVLPQTMIVTATAGDMMAADAGTFKAGLLQIGESGF